MWTRAFPPIEGAASLGTSADRRDVLIVEDEPLSAIVLEHEVRKAGGRVVGPAGDLAAALTLAREARFDAALLDVNLRGVMTYPVAEVLIARRIPFAFLTGYTRAMLPPALQACLLVAKPVFPACIRQVFETLVAGSRG